jgi:putative mRNA 3-end processing factor
MLPPRYPPFVTDLLRVTPQGLFCEAGGFHVDPWLPVAKAVITHAHSDHARIGCDSYLCTPGCAPLLHARLGAGITVQTLDRGETVDLGGTRISLHPAGHVLGSAQARIEHRGEVWVAAGDYKRSPDPTCDPFEPVRCRVFITESTFALPIYRWEPSERIMAEVNQWWRRCQVEGRTAVIFAYSLGKAQRLLAGVDPSIGPLLVHGAVLRMNSAYAEAGVRLPRCVHADGASSKDTRGKALVIAPPSAAGSAWINKFGETSTAYASGWMRVRGKRRWRAADRGFVLSDHADWDDLLRTINDTGCERVLATHGDSEPLVRFLRERGLDAGTLATPYKGEGEGEENDDNLNTPLPVGGA